MNSMRPFYKTALTLLLALLCLTVGAQTLNRSDIKIKYEDSPHPGRVHVTSVTNNYDGEVYVHFVNEYGGIPQTVHLQRGEQRGFDLTCNIVEAKPDGGSYIKIVNKPKKAEVAKPAEAAKPAESQSKPEQQSSEQTESRKEEAQSPAERTETRRPEITVREAKPLPKGKKGPYSLDEVVADFNSYIETIPYYSAAAIEEESAQVDDHVSALRNWKDKEAYIAEHHLNSYIDQWRDSLKQYKATTGSLIADYLTRLDGKRMSDRDACIDSIQAVVTERLDIREANLDRLAAETAQATDDDGGAGTSWTAVAVCALLVAVLLLVAVWLVRSSRRKRGPAGKGVPQTVSAAEASANIIVRRKTTSILRKQSLEDVIGNADYLPIDCKDFCDDSAVRRMYIKNTCIKDIYNMYAEDLRNPQNPKEDGCMVLGRWVYDGEAKEYYVSLEEIVRPGDDAVMSEYELNFGAKIKLKYTEKLRRLRRETNLQYDLTCWVHSHPGLGVFFSNSDNNVQMQLRNANHPLFLTAIVIDILTPTQEAGIFTFKRDSTMNSKADLKKLYSLEEMYKWAVDSERNSFKPEDHYNTLADAGGHSPACYGVELANGAIIDMDMLATERGAGFVGWAYGFANKQGLHTEYVVDKVTADDDAVGDGPVGCFVVAAHCSIPSVRKAVGTAMGKISFVLVYATADGLLTTIPVENGELRTDDKYYGEQKFEDLKIWTRRKR